MNTQEKNKLIAEFMGIWPNNEGVYHISKHKAYHVENLSYHKSWNWLIPVVEKIKDEVYNGIILEKVDEIDNVLTCDLRKENLYKAVVEFINHHNKQL